jgi:tetratricopeptide (TPR) repeat protein
MDISLRGGDRSTLADILYDMGGLLERRGRGQEALAHFERARLIALELADDLALGKALYGMGRVHATMGDYGTAIGHKKEALSVLERRGDTTMMAKACISIGNDLCITGKGREGAKYLERSMGLANAVGDLSTLGHAMANLTGCKAGLGDLEGAEELVRACLPISIKLNDPLMTSMLRFYSGYIHSNRGEWGKAQEEFVISIDILRDLDSPVRLGQLLIEIADISLQHNDLDEAHALLQEALDIASRIGHQKLLQQVKENMERLCT